MTLYFHPEKRRIRLWVIIVYVVLPLILISVGIYLKKVQIDKENAEPKIKEDILERY